MSGNIACAALWSPEGMSIDGELIDDQELAHFDGTEGNSDFERQVLMDCIDVARSNISHFGDLAARQYAHYHELAIEAARRYRSTRQPACRVAAYTIEGWAQHHLTDSTATGHAWNPPGSYDSQWGALTWTGLPVRMRIHDHLNEEGARMGSPFQDAGTFWGDDSDEHSATGVSIPEREGHPQRELTMRLARMGLAQVVAAAECGGAPEFFNVFVSPDTVSDPRRIYVSNESMCRAMYNREILSFVPDMVNIWGVHYGPLRDLVQECDDGRGNLSTSPEGNELAMAYFLDRMGESTDPALPMTVDPESELDLEDLGCHAGGPLVPLAGTTRDMCGNELCHVPPGTAGDCPNGMVPSGGCCHPEPAIDSGSDGAEALPWTLVASASGVFALGAAGATPGEEGEFLWLEDNEAVVNADGEWRELDGAANPETLAGIGAHVGQCGNEGSFSVFETALRIPRSQAMADKIAVLTVHGMDEGLRIQVNDHLVGYLNEADVAGTESSFPLMTNASPTQDDGTYHVRLTHLNDCGDERPLEVSLSLRDEADGDGKADAFGHDEQSYSGGCSTGLAVGSGAGGGKGASMLVMLLAFTFLRRGSRP